MSNKAAALFRVAAVAEALSWSGLLVAMVLKYLVGLGDGGVPVLGLVHGLVFLAYVAATVVAAVLLRWRLGTVALALLAGLPPLATWAFETWALRTGRLDAPAMSAHGGTGLFRVQPA